MNHLYAPWRESYHKAYQEGKQECPFCEISNDQEGVYDTLRGVIIRSEGYFVVMNKYPYSPGHILVVPFAHQHSLEEISDDLYGQMMYEVKVMSRILTKALNAGGINIGVNLGKAAGAGIEDHLHIHVMPRWIGDTNFVTTIAQTRIYAKEWDKIYEAICLERNTHQR